MSEMSDYTFEIGPATERTLLTEEESDGFLEWTVDFIDHLVSTKQDCRAFGYDVTMILERNKPRRFGPEQKPGAPKPWRRS